ncbi:hypothetical protein Q8F55_004495 [Vanrija albida]|uniref:Uncharacterized protein n=1 Tax=Vanrija albida TaxID=181172 RepID=A0ABR3Q7P3_9TREE
MQRAALGSLAVATAGSAYLAYEARRLARLYPVGPAKPYHTTHKVISTVELPARIAGKFDPKYDHYVYTTVALPDSATRVAANPLDAFVRAFYETWTLKVEGYTADVSKPYAEAAAEVRLHAPERLDAVSAFGDGGVHVHPEAHPKAIAAGLFPIVQRSPTAVVYFLIPQLRENKLQPIDGGTQELAAVRVPGGLELSYGSTVAKDPKAPMPAWMYEVHLFYQRYLLDRSARRLQKWIKEDAK